MRTKTSKKSVFFQQKRDSVAIQKWTIDSKLGLVCKLTDGKTVVASSLGPASVEAEQEAEAGLSKVHTTSRLALEGTINQGDQVVVSKWKKAPNFCLVKLSNGVTQAFFKDSAELMIESKVVRFVSPHSDSVQSAKLESLDGAEPELKSYYEMFR